MKVIVFFVLVLFCIFLVVCSCAHNPKKDAAFFRGKENLQEKSSTQCPVNCSEEELLKMDEKGLQSFSKKDLEEIVNFSGHKIHDAGDDANEWRNLYERASRVMYQH